MFCSGSTMWFAGARLAVCHIDCDITAVDILG